MHWLSMGFTKWQTRERRIVKRHSVKNIGWATKNQTVDNAYCTIQETDTVAYCMKAALRAWMSYQSLAVSLLNEHATDKRRSWVSLVTFSITWADLLFVRRSLIKIIIDYFGSPQLSKLSGWKTTGFSRETLKSLCRYEIRRVFVLGYPCESIFDIGNPAINVQMGN